jgi:serine/threonine-protein kinase
MSERFGEYELLKKIATGGMAEIHLARVGGVEGFSRRVVVKRMLPQLAVREDFVTMFLDEARLAANLVHPNIVQVFNLGEVDGSYFMAMELIDGPHLGALFAHSLRQRRPLPIELCVYLVARAADGLNYAHDQRDAATGAPLNIVHRDISPQNILVSRHGDVKVTDFGVAKAETQRAKTRTGIIKGKVSYMSPEQCLGDPVDRRTDVFALGVVLYELLTRRRLYREKSDLLIMQRITQEDLKPPSSINPAVDHELDEIALKSLTKLRDGRYASAADFSEALDIWLATQGHADSRAQLQRWMEAHAEGLGIAHEPSESVATTPSWERSGAAANAPGERAIKLPDEQTVATPAYDPGPVSDKYPRVDDVDMSPTRRDAGGDTTTSAYDTVQHAAVNPDTAVVEVGVDDGRAPPGPATLEVAPVTDSAFEEAARGAKPLPVAAIAGGAAAVLLTVGVGLFLLGGEPGAGADPMPGPADPLPTADAGAASISDKPPQDFGVVKVATTPSGVAVLVDGAPKGTSPIELKLPIDAPREITLSAVFPDQAPVTRTLKLAPGGEYIEKLLARARLAIKSTPPGAKVTIDGEDERVTPREGLWLEPGREHKITLALAGHEPFEQTVNPEPGGALDLNIELKPLEKAAEVKPSGGGGGRSGGRRGGGGSVAATYGSVTVNCAPWAVVYVDGRRKGPTPIKVSNVRTGRRRVKVVNKEFGFSKTVTVDVKKDATSKVGFRFKKTASGTYTLENHFVK